MNNVSFMKVSLNMPSCMMQFWNQCAGQILRNVTGGERNRNNLKSVNAFKQQMDQQDTENKIDHNFIS